MANEEKILEILTQMQGDISGLKQDVSELKIGYVQMQGDISELKQDVSGLKQDVSGLKQDVSVLKQDVSGLKIGYVQMQGEITQMKGEITQVKEDIHRVKAYLELDVEKRFDAVNEGIDMIQEMLVPQRQVDELRDDVETLKTVVRAHSYDIAELKKAQ